MGILEQIANPQGTKGLMEGLQVGQNIRQRQMQQETMRIQQGKALQEMQMQHQAKARQKEGRAIVGKYLQPPETAAGTLEAAPPEARPAPETGIAEQPSTEIPEGQPSQAQQIVGDLTQLPIDDMAKADTLESLRDELYGKGFTKLGGEINTLFKEEYARVKALSKEDRKTGDALNVRFGSNFHTLAKLEEQAGQEQDPAKKEVILGIAKQQYDETWANILKDPQFKDSPRINQTYQAFAEYEPGKGKYLATASLTSQKVREQLYKDEKLEETERHNRATEMISKGKDKAGRKFTKSDREMQLARKIAEKTATDEEIEEFDLLASTDPIRQMTRDILRRSNLRSATPKKITIDDVEYDFIEEMPSGKIKIRDEKGRIGYTDKP